MVAIPILLTRAGIGPDRRVCEPVTVGVPYPRGVCRNLADWCLRDERGRVLPVQTSVTDRWPDGSVRWSLLDFLASVDGSGAPPLVWQRSHESAARRASAPGVPELRVSQTGGRIRIATGACDVEIGDGPSDLLQSAGAGERRLLAEGGCRLQIEGIEAGATRIQWHAPVIEEDGAVRACIRIDGDARLPGGARLVLVARLHVFAGCAGVRLLLTVRNPRRAHHPDGYWELGDAGSVLLRGVSLALDTADRAAVTGLRYGVEERDSLQPARSEVRVHQESSGGEQWASRNHVTRDQVVPLRYRGYRASIDGVERTGHRATPIVLIECGEAGIGAAVPWFWQNFPRAISATPEGLTVGFWPTGTDAPVELQGGEQKTHECWLLLGQDRVANEPLAWCRDRLLAHPSVEHYAAAPAVDYLLPQHDDPSPAYGALVAAALDGDDTFEHKRERVDEYGWRHFGDIYGDHEAVFPKTPVAWPLVSHYNNQYDPLAGFAYQFMRTGDVRWWAHAEALARHVVDIDIYHTDEDKAAYNHGLFWHTVHYVDAGRATHRTYPRAPGSNGGGPASEQNYTTGLMLRYLMTGDRACREAALGLAQFVIDIDDGTRTVFRWLDRGHTGLATQSGTPLYHGPGRGSGNSLNALVDAHRLTGDRRFLDKAEQIIRRVVHPRQDIEALNLLDAERKWFYTMFLQALARYLDHKAERGELDEAYAYARETLLHYARWMVQYEYPYLDKPDILEYPTETWVAQDMRKCEVLLAASRHAALPDRERFLDRAAFFHDYVTTTLGTMPTRTLARPVVLLLSFGFSRAWYARCPDSSAPPPAVEAGDFGPHEVFVPQKVRALRRARLVAAAVGVATVIGLVGLVAWWVW